MGTNYTITEQRQTVGFDDAGRPVDIMRVSFTTADGKTAGTVDVPLAIYSADQVAHYVGERVAVIDAVAAL